MGKEVSAAGNNESLEILDISPKKVKVREYCSINVHFNLKISVPQNSTLIFRLRGGRKNKNDWYFLQGQDPQFKGYTKLTTEVPIQTLPITITGKELSAHYFIIEQNGIPKNTQMTFSITKTLAQSVIQSEKRIELLVKRPSEPAKLFKKVPTINIVGDIFDHINIICPSIVEKESPFTILLRPEDKYHNLKNQKLSNLKIFQINVKNNSKHLIHKISDDHKNKGVKWINNIQLNREGVYNIGIEYKGTLYQSNVIKCIGKDNTHPRLYWGYIHGHTAKSDGIRSIQAFFKNLIRAGLDFGTSTEHDNRWETSNEDFNDIREIVEKYNKKDGFTSLFGYEYGTWYTGYGDLCIYHRNNDIPILRSNINKYNSTRKLNKNLLNYKGDVLLVGHHSALRPGYRNWEYFNQSLEKLVEIYSSWGSQEYPYSEGNPIPPRYKFFGHGKYARKRGAVLGKEGCYVRDALEKGYKLGFTAGGDDHIGAFPSGPVDMDNGIYPSGIMALWSENESLSREGLWKGLNSRKCYGTTGPRIILRFWLDDFFMGDIIKLKNHPELEKKREIKVSILSPINIEKIELIRNNKVFVEKIIDRKIFNFKMSDTDKFNQISLPHSNISEKFLFYYPRIYLQKSNMGWASPIWIVD